MSFCRFAFQLVFVLFCLFVTGCQQTTPTIAPPISPNCIDQYKKATPSTNSNDRSSIEIERGVCAKLNGTPWKEISKLQIEPYPTSGLTCPYKSCLAAMNVLPDDVDFTSMPQANQPQLTYDLDAHKPTLTPADCGKINDTKSPNDESKVPECYGIWQFKKNSAGTGYVNTPEYVGPAAPDASWKNAIGRTKHFSIYALVELPPPNRLPGDVAPRQFDLIVASEFIRSPFSDSISVALSINTDNAGQFSGERVFRFAGVNEIDVPDSATESCPSKAVEDLLTCLFQKGDVVTLEISPMNQGSQITIRKEMLTVQFYAVSTLVY